MRLATYGTLAPGRSNHHQLDGLRGTWRDGSVRGRLSWTGGDAGRGYPALTLDEREEPVPLHILDSAGLPAHWPRLDAFEGEAYRRTLVQVETADGPLAAWIYLAAG